MNQPSDFTVSTWVLVTRTSTALIYLLWKFNYLDLLAAALVSSRAMLFVNLALPQMDRSMRDHQLQN